MRVGGSLDAVVPRNEFLCTKKSFEDFELKVKFKLSLVIKDPLLYLPKLILKLL